MSEKNTTNKNINEKKSIVLDARKRKGIPVVFQIKEKKQKNTPASLSLSEICEYIEKNKKNIKEEICNQEIKIKNINKKETTKILKTEKRTLQAASIADILGFNPKDKKNKRPSIFDESLIDAKYIIYYKILIKLYDRVKSGLDLHTKETLKFSIKEDSGDLSNFNSVDAGTVSFARDFAINLLSNEQDLLYEIEEAIIRITKGTYGICEITKELISKERLLAVPFTRYSLTGKKQLEAVKKKKSIERRAIFSESTLDDSNQYMGEDNDE